MDPDANMCEQLSLAKLIVNDPYHICPGDFCRLAELVLALDEWIQNGGFLPRRWREEWSDE